MTMITRARLHALLGDRPASKLRADPLPQTPGIHPVKFTGTDGVEIRALFGLPEGGRPHGAVLYCHAHGNRYDIGIDELTLGRPALYSPYAPDLLARGVAFLAIEMPCFGTRASETESAAAKRHLWQGSTLFGQMLSEQGAALDILAAHPCIDPQRLGVMGISMGGTLAWWMAALETRLRCAVSLCCFADLASLIETDAHDGHGIYMMVPGLTKAARTGEIAGLAAHSAQLHCVGLQDWSTPPKAFARARQDLERACRAAGAPPPLFHIAPDVGHRETSQMRAEVLAFLETQLSNHDA